MKPNPQTEKVVDFLLEVARHNDPETFRAFFLGVIANVVGNLPDDYWRKCLKSEACDEPGCDCHVVNDKMVAALDALLDDWKEHVPAEN